MCDFSPAKQRAQGTRSGVLAYKGFGYVHLGPAFWSIGFSDPRTLSRPAGWQSSKSGQCTLYIASSIRSLALLKTLVPLATDRQKK